MIPARLHFCWIGPVLSWGHAFAVLSAAERCGLGDIVLHHTEALAGNDALRALASAPGVRLSRIDAHGTLGRTGRSLGLGDALARLYARLERPAMRADMLRAAILYAEGGVYLDFDTVTVASLVPLLQAEVFVGSERIVWPDSVRRSRSGLVLARHLALDLARKLCAAMPGGWRLFGHVQHLYPARVNNAVMGAVPNAAFIAGMLRAMAAQTDLRARAALGPHLLQAMVAGDAGRDVTVHPPAVFYPLAPEISRHWFRIVARARLGRVLSADTRVVHWYASVRNAGAAAALTPATVRRDCHRQLYSALVWACIGRLPAMAGEAGGRACLQDGADLPTEGSAPFPIESQPP